MKNQFKYLFIAIVLTIAIGIGLSMLVFSIPKDVLGSDVVYTVYLSSIPLIFYYVWYDCEREKIILR